MDYSRETPRGPEHAYNVREKQEARRKLMAKRVKTVIATGVAAATFLGVSKGIEAASEKDYGADAYYNGKIEIVMSDNLNVRKEPYVINNDSQIPNTVDWQQIKAINGAKTEGGKSFVIEDPLITYGDDPTTEGVEKGSWVTFDAKVDNGLGVEDDKLYVSLSQATSEYVKPVESGSFIKLDSGTSSQDLGKVTVNP
jgi:hypothetical protein